ncbi:uncharacterized protein LOC128553641 [Mercenaria mercenaria]|uniref:uncharacterized protein LOC128553641 n=1 Tax=Mercenaria mercenaria TaxID=6596 RepID=UPI00234F7AAC|nr:uncharacterized protein LOC128553641 [Mercenaria mercenaria]
MLILSSVLKDPKYINSQREANDAWQKIERLKKDTYSIALATGDIKDLVREEMQFEVTETIDGAKEKRTDKYLMLRNAMQILSSTFDSVDMALRNLKRTFSLFGHTMQRDFAEQLIKIYQEQCSTLPISALLEEEDTQLLDFFAEPTMLQIDHHKIKGSADKVASYKDIFFKDERPCRNIYITGDAGIGKTAFCQRMVLTWCHAKSDGKPDDNFSQVNIDVMKMFDILFYVSLRETKLCHVAEMIKQQMQVADKADLITHILEKENCLIIFDGLDEWTHPTSNPLCPRNRKIPHRQIANDCTYLTTSRPWKLEGDRLKTNEIDQLIELKGLGKAACNKLSVSVVKHLNKTFKKSKELSDFQTEVARNKLENVCAVPVIMMQLICLWFDGMTLSISRSSIYGKTLDMLFKRTTEREKKTSLKCLPLHFSLSMIEEIDSKAEEMNRKLTECFSLPEAAESYGSLFHKLGNLAFDTLFSSGDEESGLVFESSRGEIYDLSESEMKYLLSVGILSKNKVVGTLSKRKLKLSFLHKSLQEYLAAMFIAMQGREDDNIVTKVFSTCKTLDIFLRYENVFVFLSGICPEMLSKFSERIKGFLSSDRQICQYRSFADYKYGFVVMLPPFSILTDPKFTEVRNAEQLLISYQSFVLQCQQECQISTGIMVDLPLEDIVINENNDTYSPQLHPQLQSLLKSNQEIILKSVSTTQYNETLLSGKYGLEKLSINLKGSNRKVIETYEQCVFASRQTLTCLSMSHSLGVFDIGTLMFPNLKSIDLFDLNLEHKEITGLFSFISNHTDLIQIMLFNIKCSEHDDECTGAKLDLSLHRQLDFLRLQHVYAYGQHETKLNSSNLGTLIFEDSLKATHVTHALLGDIRNAPHLFELTLLDIKSRKMCDVLTSVLPTLKHLKRLSLYNCDFGEKCVQLNCQKEIEVVCMLNSDMTLSAFYAFVDSIPSDTKHGVSVHLRNCRINNDSTPEFRVMTAADYILSKNRFRVVNSDPSGLHFDTKIRQEHN